MENGKLTKQQAFKCLSENHVNWDRRDSKHIVVWTSGYITADCQRIEEYLLQAGMRNVEQVFDNLCGQTRTTYRHN